MGESGYKRLMSKYTIEKMKETYEELYRICAEEMGIPYPEEDFHIK